MYNFFKYIILIIGIYHVGYSQNIYHKDSYTILADSLHLEGNYRQALIIRKQAINDSKNSSEDYNKYKLAKYFHTQSCVYEFTSYNYAIPDKAITKIEREKYLDSSLNSSIKARDIYKDVENPDKRFQYDLQNRIYHQTAYLGNWKHALKEAQLGLEILKDTLSKKDKKFVDLIYDIGYIFGQLGDYTKAVENYQTSLDLYQIIIGENNTDVAQAYNNISLEYRNLGLRKKELESLLKAKNIWENLQDETDIPFLFNCYSNLYYWYSYYGDFDKAEEYLNKKDKLRKNEVVNKTGFLRNDEEIHKDKLNQSYDLMLHFLRKKDTSKAIYYTINILNTLNSINGLLDFETEIFSSTLKYYSTLLKNKEPEKALHLISKAVEIQKKYELIYYTNSIPFQIEKVKILLLQKQYVKADGLLDSLLTETKDKNSTELFELFILKSKTSEALGTINKEQYFLDKALSQSLKNTKAPLNTLSIKNLKPIISFETVDGFLIMGDFYFRLFQESNNEIDLNKAIDRFTIASKIYNNLYLGQRYNSRLFNTYVSINKRLLQCAYENPENNYLLINAINEIENNGSKLIWSQFMFNNNRKQVKISNQLLNQEEDLKAQLNFYNNKLYDQDDISLTKKQLWEEKIYDLNILLSKVVDTIKKQSNSYYQFTQKNFNIEILQQKLEENSAIVKYIIVNKKIYSFLILNNDIKLYQLGNTDNINKIAKKLVNKLSNRNLNYKNELGLLKKILIEKIPLNGLNKITIVPDGFLFYIPFEILLLSEDMPLISYSSSLILLNEQKKMFDTKKSILLGAFSDTTTENNKIVNADIEINNILTIFKGKAFKGSTKKIFLEQANKFDILHFAMHSSIDISNPQFSSLNFNDKEDNNRLFISDLYNESLNAKLAVLSSCNTGSGSYENGEGVISISRAFTYAGVPSTVMSLWKVPDKESAEVMMYFYQNLKKGQTKDKALLQAKLEYLKNTDDNLLKHPYYWAGFVITGDTSPVIAKSSPLSRKNIFWLISVPFFLIITFLIYKKSI